MKILVKFLVVLGVLCVSGTVISQNERYVEVVSIDTLVLKPVKFHYQITISKLSTEIDVYGDLMDSQDPEKYTEGKTLFEIATLLKKEKFDFSIGESKKSPLSYNKPDSSIVAVLEGEQELNRIKLLISDENGAEGAIIDVEYESPAKYQEGSYRRLYSRALNQATSLAKITKNEIGDIISISEFNSNDSNSWMDLYKGIMEEAAFGLFGQSKEDGKSEIVKMIFRFELR